MSEVMTATEHRTEAARHEQSAADSWERSDTDGFLSQWADGLNAQMHRLAADIAENGGKHEFVGLFDAKGRRVKAKLIYVADRFRGYGKKPVWMVLDANDQAIEWVNAFRDGARSKMAKLGLHEAKEEVAAKAFIDGEGHGLSGRAWVAAKRLDRGYPADEIVMGGAGRLHRRELPEAEGLRGRFNPGLLRAAGAAVPLGGLPESRLGRAQRGGGFMRFDFWQKEREAAEVLPSGLRVLRGTSKRTGEPTVMMWQPKGLKPNASYRFRNELQREDWINRQVVAYEARQAALAERKAARAGRVANAEEVNVGDIFDYQWGYDQTQTEYWLVVAKQGRRVVIRELAQEAVPGSQGFMCESRIPIPDKFLNDKTETKLVQWTSDGKAYLAQPYGWCSKWKGRPLNTSWYA